MTVRACSRILAALGLLAMAASTQPVSAAEPPHVLVWGGAYGFRHPSITDAERTFLELSQSGDFTVEITENPADLNAIKLAGVDVLAWVSTTGKPPLTEQQREDIIRWSYCGGGTLAFHAAADSNYGWAEHAELIGGQFDSHPHGFNAPAARMLVEDNTHPITEGWTGKTDFMMVDEYYRWRTAKAVPDVSLPRKLPGVHVLLSLDEKTVADGIQSGSTPYEHHQPIAWTKTFRGGGRVYYNNMGHSDTTWYVPEFRTSIVNGIGWVSEKRLDAGCFSGDTELPAPAGPPAPDMNKVGSSCSMQGLKARSAKPHGEAKRLTEGGDSMTLPSAGVPGGLGWGSQLYMLDLSKSDAATADVTVKLTWPSPLDDYDLSVTTGWGWYGSHELQGATTETVTMAGVPHCRTLEVYGDNMYAASQIAPSIELSVTPQKVLPSLPKVLGSKQTPRNLPATGVPIPAVGGVLLLAGAALVRRVVRI